MFQYNRKIKRIWDEDTAKRLILSIKSNVFL